MGFVSTWRTTITTAVVVAAVTAAAFLQWGFFL